MLRAGLPVRDKLIERNDGRKFVTTLQVNVEQRGVEFVPGTGRSPRTAQTQEAKGDTSKSQAQGGENAAPVSYTHLLSVAAFATKHDIADALLAAHTLEGAGTHVKQVRRLACGEQPVGRCRFLVAGGGTDVCRNLRYLFRQ